MKFFYSLSRFFLLFCLIFGVGVSSSYLIFAVNSKTIDEILKASPQNPQDRLNQISTDIKSFSEKYWKDSNLIETLQDRISPLAEEQANLEGQLKIFDAQIDLDTKKITNIEIQINQKRLELAKLEETLDRAQAEMESAQTLVASFIYEMNRAEEQYSVSGTSSPDLIKLLLSGDSISKSLQEIEFLSVMESLGRDVFHRLEAAQQVFLEKKLAVEQSTESLNALKYALEEERRNMIALKEGREKLLEETKGQQKIYEILLAESKKQAEESLTAIANLKDNQSSIEKKLATFNSGSSIVSLEEQQKSSLRSLLNTPENSQKYDIDKLVNDVNYNTPLVWPISPERGISARFHDPKYKAFFKVGHNAIDIVTPQGTPIHAPASAYTEEVKDNGYGYSYIILVHKDGLSTLYGHVSEIDVKKGELVQMGAIIGKTGGTPGTKGAGTMTTGAHLHFEVHKNGVHVDPLDYLPKGLLPQ